MTLMVRAKALSFCVFFPLLLTACGGGSGGSLGLPNQPTLPSACTVTSGASIQQVYPAPGASGVSDTLSNVVLAANGAIQSTAYLVLVPNGESLTSGEYTYGALVLDTSSVPSGAAAADFGNPIYYMSPNSNHVTLPGNTLESVYFADSAQTCTPVLLGTFTPQ